MNDNIFRSYFMGGFECSTHRNQAGKSIDVIDWTKHDRFAEADYRRLFDFGMHTARDGARWHLIEQIPGQYDFSSVIGQIRAARKTGIQIIWDLFHYGYPNDLDIFSDEFIDRFARYTEKFVELLVDNGETRPVLCLVNEISFFSWIAGQVGVFYPFAVNRGGDLKRQLVKASIAAAEKIKKIAPGAVLIQTEPVIRVLPSAPEDEDTAAAAHNGQYEALDMLLGYTEPALGGKRHLIDLIGINYYTSNQWYHPSGARIFPGEDNYHPFNKILQEFYARYQKPLFIAETGIEDEARPVWFEHICHEVRLAESAGVPILGICLYPIVNHPGWDDDRHCHNGLWDYANEAGEREIYAPLAEEISRQMNSLYKTAAI